MLKILVHFQRCSVCYVLTHDLAHGAHEFIELLTIFSSRLKARFPSLLQRFPIKFLNLVNAFFGTSIQPIFFASQNTSEGGIKMWVKVHHCL